VLLLLLADLLGPQGAVKDAPCEMIEDEIPAFVDYEQAHGMAAAARAFPIVWWHTLVCPRCDELYRTLQELGDLPATPWSARPVEVYPRFSLRARLQIHPGMIRQLLGMGQRLGVAWGQQQTDMVIAEHQQELGLVQILLRRDLLGEIVLIVRAQPPIEGTAVLFLDNAQLQATFDVEGRAVFAGLSDEQLNSTSGVALSLSIVPQDLLP
jgi:hypothetical protein